MEGLTTAVLIIGIIVGILSIFALLYAITANRRKTITLKKVDYLVEDITHKSETLSSTVETVVKISNYIDVFEVVARKNIKSVAKIISRNKDDLYKIANRIKKIAIGPEANGEEKKGGK